MPRALPLTQRGHLTAAGWGPVGRWSRSGLRMKMSHFQHQLDVSSPLTVAKRADSAGGNRGNRVVNTSTSPPSGCEGGRDHARLPPLALNCPLLLLVGEERERSSRVPQRRRTARGQRLSEIYPQREAAGCRKLRAADKAADGSDKQPNTC